MSNKLCKVSKLFNTDNLFVAFSGKKTFEPTPFSEVGSVGFVSVAAISMCLVRKQNPSKSDIHLQNKASVVAFYPTQDKFVYPLV